MYTHLFFDLDHTLWDFDRNSAEAIAEIYEVRNLAAHGVPSAAAFSAQFIDINRKLWLDFERNLISHQVIREQRFPMVFAALGLTDTSACIDLNDEYLRRLPQKTHLTEAARDLLNHLQGRYRMHIITNGFDEIQAVKLASSDIAHYFENVITLERAGAKKPDRRIFDYALAVSGARLGPGNLMIGDSYEADILGAMAVGLDTAFYNPANQVVDNQPTYDIQHWHELMGIL
jgi:YjjG family noncanonical pyrimidine nucleotidase